jgi:hypothetical protein
MIIIISAPPPAALAAKHNWPHENAGGCPLAGGAPVEPLYREQIKPET